MDFERSPGHPPVQAAWLPALEAAPHAHAFLSVLYLERGSARFAIDRRTMTACPGDVVVIAPGEVVTPELGAAEAWAAWFPPDAVADRAPGAFLSWRAHPLLYPFVGRAAGGAQRLRVPQPDRHAWSARFAALDAELRARRDGYAEAALAHLTLLLVGLARLAADVAGDLRLRDEPVLASTFAAIEARFREPISLADVAADVGLTPAHLTTVVRRKTGRTVQAWIAERRMAEARRLLAGTDLTVEAIGAAVGFRDPSYFVRRFRRAHGATPLAWRRAGRS
jgi:AraC family transcriptional activator of pobA